MTKIWTVLIVVSLMMFGCGGKPQNQVIGKNTKLETTITIRDNSNIVVVISPDTATKSGDVGQDADTTADWTNTLKDLLSIAQPGSNFNRGGDQIMPTASNTTQIDNSKEDNSQENTGKPDIEKPPKKPPEEIPDKEEDGEKPDKDNEGDDDSDKPANLSDQWHHFFEQGDGSDDSFWKNKSMFSQCTGEEAWEWCRIKEGAEYKIHPNLDDGKVIWVLNRPNHIDEGTIMECGRGDTKVSFPIGKGRPKGVGLFGSCK